jgi:hypothetical protein
VHVLPWQWRKFKKVRLLVCSIPELYPFLNANEPSQLWCRQLCIAGMFYVDECTVYTSCTTQYTVTGWQGWWKVRGSIAGYGHMKTRCKRIRKVKITWWFNGFPLSVLYGKQCWTYVKIIKMKHWCATTTTFCDNSTIKIFIILWHFLEVIHTFNNCLISYSHV